MTPEPGSLRSRTFRAGLWAGALRSSAYLVGLVRAVVIARLLAPDDVGLFGIAALAIATLEAFTDTGFREALIHREEGIEAQLPTAWTVQLLRNTAIAGLLIAGAPLVALFFKEPSATALVRAVSLAVVLSGFENTAVVRFERHLDFGRHFQLNVAGLAADLVVSAAAAWVLRSPWALIYGLIAGRLVRTITSYILTSYRPHWSLDTAVLREFYGYGIWVFVNRVVHFLALRGDDILVGRLLGPFALGIYQMAFQIGELAARELTSIVSSVAFPAYSRVQKDRERVRRAYLLTVEGVASVVLPIAALTIFLAEPAVILILGDRWIQVAPVLPILVWSASLRGIVATAGAVYMALGKPRLSAQVSVLRVVVLFALIVPFARRFGLVGVAWAVLISTVTTVPFAVAYVRRLLHVTLGDSVRHIAPGVVLALVAVAPFVAFRLAGWTGGAANGIGTMLALVAYGLSAWITLRVWGMGPLRVLAAIGSRQSEPELPANP